MKAILYLIIFLTALSMTWADGEVYIGNKVYVDDAQLYLSAEPHTASSSGWVYGEINVKQYNGDIDIGFGFDKTISYPTTIEYKLSNGTWKTIDSLFDQVNVNYNDKDLWYVADSINLNTGQLYEYRFWLEVEGKGKYDIAVKPSIYTINQAISNNAFYLLDPFYDDGNEHLYYSFDDDKIDGNVVIDETLPNLNGTNNGALTGQAGVINQSFYFNSDYVNIAPNTFDLKNDFTVTAWASFDNTNTVNTIWWQQTTAYGYAAIRGLADGRIVCEGRTSSGFIEAFTPVIDSTTWYFIACAYNGSNMLVSLNGTDWAVSSGSGAMINGGSNDRTIGRTPGVGAWAHEGYIDELGIWEKPLNVTELNILYNEGLAFNPYLPIPEPPINDTNQTNGNFTGTVIVSTDIEPLTNMLERTIMLIIWLILFIISVLAKGRTESNIGLFMIIQLVVGIFTGVLWIPTSFLIGFPIIILAAGLPIIIRLYYKY